MKLRNKLPRYTLSTVVILVVLYLTLSPNPTCGVRIRLFPHADKIVHMLMFGSIALSVIADSCRHRRFSHHIFTLRTMEGFDLAVLLGGGIELLQGAMRMGRGCDIYDFLADIVGAILAAILFALFYRLVLIKNDRGD